MKVIKRDGRQFAYNEAKITNGVVNAAKEVGVEIPDDKMKDIMIQINSKVEELNKESVPVEKIQDIAETVLYKAGYRKVRDAYDAYRKARNEVRDLKSDLMHVIDKIGVETDRDNANVGNNFSSKLLRIASESNKWHNLAMMPKSMAKRHEEGELYYHDLDSYNLTTNCLHIPTGEVLQRGFNTGYGTLNPPKRIETAAELSCILLQSTQNDMFGGQSHPDFDNDMAPFIEPTRQEIKDELIELGIEGEKLEQLTEKKLKQRVHQAMQGVVYNLNTMHARAGSQVPFSSINLGLPQGTEQEQKDAAMICGIFLEEYEKGLGKGENPIFPNIIFRVKAGVNRDPEDPYYYLYRLACKVAAKRMNPTFMNIDADFNKEYYDKGYMPATMGCRTALMANINGEPGCKGRGNIAPTTINLVRVGIQAAKAGEEIGDLVNMPKPAFIEHKFFELLNDKLLQARESLLHRYDVLKNLRIKDLPFVAGQGLMVGSENKSPDDSIEDILKNGTFGIGFIGLAETLTALTGKHHGEDENARDLGERIVAFIRDFCDKYKQEDKLNWSCYATPAEGLSGKFIKQDKAKYGIIPGVTDKDYYTNSYHIPVGHVVSIKDKILIEAPYHKLCNGGHISYIELDNYPDSEVIANIVSYAFSNSNTGYLGINFHIRYCRECGTFLEREEHCTKCGSDNIQGISRVTGYLSLDERFGPGKQAERADRLSHDQSHIKVY